MARKKEIVVRKISASTLGLGVATISAYVVGRLVDEAIPEAVAAAWGSVCVILASIAIPDSKEAA